MKILIASVVIGPLMLSALSVTGAGWSAFGAPTQLAAAGGDSSLDRNTYDRKARDDVEEWRQKLSDFSDKAKAKGQKQGTALESDLNKAWTKTEAEAHKLQTATAEDWQSAKVSYGDASHALADAWHRIDGADK